jgi:hypothetical protein
MDMDERRSEPRIEAGLAVVVIPLADVASRWLGQVVNVSRCGLKIHVDALLDPLPRAGDAYRIQAGEETLLCEVRRYQVEDKGGSLGLKVIRWGGSGALDRLIRSCEQLV